MGKLRGNNQKMDPQMLRETSDPGIISLAVKRIHPTESFNKLQKQSYDVPGTEN